MIGDSSSTSVATTTTTLSADDVAEQRREVLNELSKYSYQLAELESQKYEIEQQVSTRKQCWQWGFWQCRSMAYNLLRVSTDPLLTKVDISFRLMWYLLLHFNFFFRYRQKHTTYRYARVCLFVTVIDYSEKILVGLIRFWRENLSPKGNSDLKVIFFWSRNENNRPRFGFPLCTFKHKTFAFVKIQVL